MPLRSVIFAGLIAFLPGAALAQETCGGVDLFSEMPDTERTKIQEAADQLAYGTGLMWRATKDDTVIDFFGTYHFKHKFTDAHLERVKPLIAEADKVFLEMSNDDQNAVQREMATDPSIMFITDGPTLPDLLGEEDWAKFSQEMQSRNFPGFMAAKFKPLWAAMMLSIGPCEARAGTLEAKGIDVLIGDYAAEVGNPSRSLEDFTDVLGLLDDVPMSQQLNLIRSSLGWPGNPDNLSYTIRQMYFDEEIALMWEFARYLTLKYGGDMGEDGFDLFESVLLETRNNDWIDTLNAKVAPGDRVFIAVGAGHFPGEIGILRLLENEGYKIERIPL